VIPAPEGKLEPEFSVVIPLHNKEPHIARAMRSVLAQTHEDYEVLVVDDASTDGGLRVVEGFQDARIRVLQRTSPGPGGYAARNLAIAEARGGWVAFLDADDEWFPDHLASYRALLERFPDSSVLGSGWDMHNPQGLHAEWYPDAYFARHHRRGSHVLDFAGYLQAEVAGARPIWTSVACIDRRLLVAAGGFPEGRVSRGGDVDTWLRCIETAGSLSWSAHIGATYHRDAVNMVTRSEVATAACERETIRGMLPRHDRGTQRLLKKFGNRRSIGAWKQRATGVGARRVSLVGQLFLGADPIRATFWLVMSVLPVSVFRVGQGVSKSVKRLGGRFHRLITGSRTVVPPRARGEAR
jgi:GT2 family glycosyltransferase